MLEKEQNIFVSVDHLQDNYLGVLGEHALLWVCVYTAYCIKLQVPRAVERISLIMQYLFLD